MVRAWKEALLKKAPLSDPGFRFRAAVSTAGGPARVEVDALSKKVDDLSAADMAKILKRCLDLAADIEPLMIAKAEAEKAGTSEAEAKKPSAGMQRLRKLGLDGLVGETDVPEEDSDESEEVESDPTERNYMDRKTTPKARHTRPKARCPRPRRKPRSKSTLRSSSRRWSIGHPRPAWRRVPCAHRAVCPGIRRTHRPHSGPVGVFGPVWGRSCSTHIPNVRKEIR